MLRKITLIGLSGTLLLLSACGGTKPGAGAEEPVQPQQKKEPVTLYFYNVGSNFNAEGYFEEKFGKQIKEKFPHKVPPYYARTYPDDYRNAG
ncbi:MAG: hypothetical protein K0Q94_6794 [Paenibacillus sp.]|nr:hypothetical protein [Paenibacillus sp.]